MTDYKSLLLDAMNQGVSLEDVMKNISDAATSIEKERAAASKYDKYNGRAWKSFGDGMNTNPMLNAIVYADKIATEDMAIVMTHFICQNVPGYATAMAKVDMDPIKTYTDLMNSQVAAAKVIADNQDKSDEEKGAAMFSHLLGEVMDSIMKETANKEDSLWMLPPSMRTSARSPFGATIPVTDDQKIADFFKKAGL